ncbi:hypothetical protein BWI17_04415 [Betaproteobacteria bacterium GR16-43]|nr:hypothetical protein BWI17_04415 [Betaproteobacteria bacterium GR16-43]
MKTLILVSLVAVALAPAAHAADAKVDRSKGTQKLQDMGKAATRPYVTVYEVKSNVSEIDARGTTAMFTTALIKSRQFRVVERNRLAEGVGREREMNASGVTSGEGATKQLKGAGFVFEASITELATQVKSSSSGFSIGGMQVGQSAGQDELGMDIRVLNVQTGEVLDAINVRKKLDSSGSSVNGVGSLLDTIASRRGINTGGLTPDVNAQNSKRESLDRALRELIELAVLELASRQKEWELD